MKTPVKTPSKAVAKSAVKTAVSSYAKSVNAPAKVVEPETVVSALRAAPILPEGWKVIGRTPSWDMDATPVIEGYRGETHIVPLSQGTEHAREVRTFQVMDEEHGAITVWESSMLRDFFEQSKDGDYVRIEYLGLGPVFRNGQQPPKMFHCAIRIDESEETGEEE